MERAGPCSGRARQRAAASGSAAVLAAYAALLRPGDTVLAMGLTSRGTPHPRFAGQLLRALVRLRGVRAGRGDGRVDYRQVQDLARAHRPKAIVCGSISYSRHLEYSRSGRSPTRSGPT